MADAIAELAANHPLIFLGLLGMGLLAVVILFVVAIKITKLILKGLVFLVSVIMVLVLAVITLVAAEHVIAALTYDPPETVPPAEQTMEPEPTDAAYPEPQP